MASDWATHFPDAAAPISANRARLGKYYADVALLEHASVAAFARFVLELLSLGAPAHLVQAAQQAMGDEIEHAQLCFGLARSFGSDIQAPGALTLDGALATSEFRDIVERALLEACIGETLAAIEAAEALEAARTPEVRLALERIAKDEAEHALLGFGFVRWALTRARPELRLEMQATFRELVARELRRASALPHLQAGDDLSDYGLLPEPRVRALRIAVLRDVIQPAVDALETESRRAPSPGSHVESC
jgi:hypothetical protein